MTSINSLRRGVLGLSLSMLLAAAPSMHAQDVSTDYDHHVDFSQYHTFSIYRVQTADPLYQERIEDDLTRDLESHGLQRVPSGGDLAVTAIGDVTNQQEYNTFYNDLGPGFGWRGWGWWGGRWDGPVEATTTVQNVPVGTLMVDLYDTRTHNLVFRGRAQADLHTKHTDKNVELLNKSINKIFDHFPPKEG
ncbi:MAG TPA: DUF4136 domain-containing protein [Acidobacteriaceae bacterium]